MVLPATVRAFHADNHCGEPLDAFARRVRWAEADGRTRQPRRWAQAPRETVRRQVQAAPFHENDLALVNDVIGPERGVLGSDRSRTARDRAAARVRRGPGEGRVHGRGAGEGDAREPRVPRPATAVATP